MRTHFLSVSIAALLTFTGCAEPADSPELVEPTAEEAETTAMDTDALNAPPSLAGTQWRLIEFQSMDDSMEQPQDTALYTMRLDAEGTVAMQLNCNRGTGTWSAEPGSDATPDIESGTFTIGPMATTRAWCPPPSMDEKIARDAEFIRSYFLRGDTLSLSLMADAGIYVWVHDSSGD